jgi:hypothetical protein
MERDSMGLWKNSESKEETRRREAEAPPEERREPRAGTVVSIPADVAAEMSQFSNQKSSIFGDSVEVDLSRNGWLALASFAISPDRVVRTDQQDAQAGVLTVTLQRVPGGAVTMESVPQVRFGDGLRVVGVERVVLRFSTQQSAERPFWFHAVGSGQKAFYAIETDSPREWRGRSVEVRSEVRRVDGAYRFDWSAEAKP